MGVEEASQHASHVTLPTSKGGDLHPEVLHPRVGGGGSASREVFLQGVLPKGGPGYTGGWTEPEKLTIVTR